MVRIKRMKNSKFKQETPQKKRNTKVLLLITLAILIALGLILAPVAFSYSNILLINPEITASNDDLIAQIPLLPKTPKQIIARAKKVNQSLNSYKNKTSLVLSAEKVKLVDILTDGAIKNANSDKTESSNHVKGQSLFPAPVNFEFQTVTQGTTLYFKVDKGIRLPGFDTTKLENGWYQIDLQEFQKDLKVATRTDVEITRDVKKELDRYLEELRAEGSFGKEASFSEITEQGKQFYQIKLKVTKEPLSKYFLGGGLQDKNSTLTILINKADFYLEKISLQSEKLSKDKKSINLSFTYDISAQNQDFTIEKPRNATKLNNPIELYLLLNDKNAGSNVESLFKALGGEVKDVVADLLTVERLTKVIILLPKSL